MSSCPDLPKMICPPSMVSQGMPYGCGLLMDRHSLVADSPGVQGRQQKRARMSGTLLVGSDGDALPSRAPQRMLRGAEIVNLGVALAIHRWGRIAMDRSMKTLLRESCSITERRLSRRCRESHIALEGRPTDVLHVLGRAFSCSHARRASFEDRIETWAKSLPPSPSVRTLRVIKDSSAASREGCRARIIDGCRPSLGASFERLSRGFTCGWEQVWLSDMCVYIRAYIH